MEILIKTKIRTIETDDFFKKFGNNEIRLDIPKDVLDEINKYTKIEFRFKDNESLFKLLLLDNVLERNNLLVDYYLWYLPYSRMDRIKEDETAFSLEIIANLINNLKSANKKYTLDAHSDVSLALVRNIKELGKDFSFHNEVIKRVLQSEDFDEKTILVFPDAGARKRFENKVDLSKVKNIITCDKSRDFQTGQIKEIIANFEKRENKSDDFENIFVIDDLCSYGGTFVGVKEAINKIIKDNKAKYNLIITHCEDVILKGQVLNEYEKVFTTDSLLTITHPKIDITNLTNLI